LIETFRYKPEGGVVRFFIDIIYGPRADSVSNRNKRQSYFMGW
jgi:hypothetical protein